MFMAIILQFELTRVMAPKVADKIAHSALQSDQGLQFLRLSAKKLLKITVVAHFS